MHDIQFWETLPMGIVHSIVLLTSNARSLDNSCIVSAIDFLIPLVILNACVMHHSQEILTV